jgi:hypothetical protein
MWHAAWDWLKRLLGGRVPRLEAHPNFAGDRDERRLEHEAFEGTTRHVGSHADEPRPSASRPSAPPPAPSRRA